LKITELPEPGYSQSNFHKLSLISFCYHLLRLSFLHNFPPYQEVYGVKHVLQITNFHQGVAMEKDKEFYDRLSVKGISRRDFMKFCGIVTATIGLAPSFVPKVAEVFAAAKQRAPIIWLHFGECTGCSESLLRTMYPWLDELIMEVISIEYHETIMAAAGQQAEDVLHAAVKKYEGEFICVVEGAIPTKTRESYGKIGNKTFLKIAKDVCPKAKAVIAVGTCASLGPYSPFYTGSSRVGLLLNRILRQIRRFQNENVLGTGHGSSFHKQRVAYPYHPVQGVCREG